MADDVGTVHLCDAQKRGRRDTKSIEMFSSLYKKYEISLNDSGTLPRSRVRVVYVSHQ